MYKHLENSKNILISGCGGGYDIFCGLDLFFNLVDQGKNVVLGSYTFTNNKLLMKVGTKIDQYCYKIDKNTQFDEETYIKNLVKIIVPPADILEQMHYTREEYIQANTLVNKFDGPCYFPEYNLVMSLAKHNLSIPIYCFMETGIKQLTEAYNKVIEIENIDTIILMDGGTDSLMTGIEKDENGKRMLGTPFEDISSIVATFNCSSCVTNKFLYCLWFNVDRFHDVTDENFLCNTANLIKNGYFVGSYMLNIKNESTRKYIDVFMDCNPANSIVNSHVISAIQGHFGDYCPEWLRKRDGVLNHKQYIHPLMALYWIYDLEGVHKNLKYDVDKLKETIEEYEILQLLKL